METLECIQTRRSIRKYKNKEVSDELIKKILKAGMSAPSAANEQPWQFVVVTEKDLLEKIAALYSNVAMAKEASAAILVCADLAFEKSKDLWILDCAAATENILLATHDLGLGAVWTASYPRQERMELLKKLFSLPDNIIPFSFIPIGYPDQEYKKEDRFREDRLHYNGW